NHPNFSIFIDILYLSRNNGCKAWFHKSCFKSYFRTGDTCFLKVNTFHYDTFSEDKCPLTHIIQMLGFFDVQF
ncbi:unnamed protein product, partial [Arabidopsis halleri]